MPPTRQVMTRVNTQMLTCLYEILCKLLIKSGYQYFKSGKIVPYWGAFLCALANPDNWVDTGKSLIFTVPYRKATNSRVTKNG
jgi:hypothetical protein